MTPSRLLDAPLQRVPIKVETLSPFSGDLGQLISEDHLADGLLALRMTSDTFVSKVKIDQYISATDLYRKDLVENVSRR